MARPHGSKNKKNSPAEVTKAPEVTGTAPTPLYSITFAIGDAKYMGEGQTVLEALTNLKAPEKILNKVLLTLIHGDFRKEIPLAPFRARRMLYPTVLPYTAKSLTLLLK